LQEGFRTAGAFGRQLDALRHVERGWPMLPVWWPVARRGLRAGGLLQAWLVDTPTSALELSPQLRELGFEPGDPLFDGIASGIAGPCHLEDREQLAGRGHVPGGRTHLPHRDLATAGWLAGLRHQRSERLLGETCPLSSDPDQLGDLVQLPAAPLISVHPDRRAGVRAPLRSSRWPSSSVISPTYDCICSLMVAECQYNVARRRESRR
jgi:hypothetical protein